jgi:hypothetical protein
LEAAASDLYGVDDYDCYASDVADDDVVGGLSPELKKLDR